MSRLFLIFIPAFFAVSLQVPQTTLIRLDAPDAVILNVGWTTPSRGTKSLPFDASTYGPEIRPTATGGDSPQQGGQSSADRSEAGFPTLDGQKRGAAGSRPSVLLGLKNTGSKGIRAVDWELLFVEKSTGTIYKRIAFQRDEDVKPGSSIYFSQKSVYDAGWRRLEAEQKQGRAKVMIIIKGVKYDDGTTWQRP